MEHQSISLNVLGYQEEQGGWVALALEMDLRGYGETFDEAFEDLAELINMQVSFSRFKGQPELIWKAAASVIEEALEDMAMVRKLKEGEQFPLISREDVFRILEPGSPDSRPVAERRQPASSSSLSGL